MKCVHIPQFINEMTNILKELSWPTFHCFYFEGTSLLVPSVAGWSMTSPAENRKKNNLKSTLNKSISPSSALTSLVQPNKGFSTITNTALFMWFRTAS